MECHWAILGSRVVTVGAFKLLFGGPGGHSIALKLLKLKTAARKVRYCRTLSQKVQTLRGGFDVRMAEQPRLRTKICLHGGLGSHPSVRDSHPGNK